MMDDWSENGDPIARDRFCGPVATERYQPHDQRHALKEEPMNTSSIAPYAVATKIAMGPTGQGATFEVASPIGGNWHEHLVDESEPAVMVKP